MIPFARVLKYGNIAPEPEVTTIKDYKIGTIHEVLLSSSGDLWGIGYNTNGQLGLADANTNSIGVWTKIHGNVRLMGVSGTYTVVVTHDNKIYFTGYNLTATSTAFGWIEITPYMGAVVVENIDALFCTAAMMHIKMADGSLYAYGLNSNTNSGLTQTGAIGIATKVDLPSAVKDMRYTFAAGTVLCQLENSSVYGWGRNANGELGQGNTTLISTPKLLAGASIAINTSYSASAVVSGTASLVTCGNQYGGQIGNGNTTLSHFNVTIYAARTYPSDTQTIRSPIDFSTSFTSAFMSPDGIYYTGTARVPFGGANGAVTVGIYTKCSDLPIPYGDIKHWCSGNIGGAICSTTEIYQCGNGRYIAGDGENAGRYGFRKTPLPWDDY